MTGVTHDDKDMENLIHAFLETDKVPHPQGYVEKPVNTRCFLRTIEEALSTATCRPTAT